MFLGALQTWITPATPLEVVVAVTAILAALFAVVSEGNRTADHARAWYQRSRVKAFLFLLSGGGVSLLLDLRSLTSDATLDKTRIAGLFTLWAALVVAGLLALGALAVLVETGFYAIRHTAFRRHLLDLPVIFLVQGWDASRRAKDDIFASIERGLASGLQDERRAADAASVETLGSLAQISIRVLRDIGQSNAAQRSHMVNEIFTSIANAIRRRGGDPALRLRLNYLALRDFSGLSDGRRASLLFTFGDETRYAHVLALRQRHDGAAEEPLGQPILIPVDSAAAGPDQLLPGAPQLVHGLEYVLVQPQKLSFAPGVPDATRKRISAFFRALGCRSVLSLRLSVGNAVVGVVNIESSHPNMIGTGESAVSDVLTIVKPFATILAYVVEQDENVRPV